VVGVAGIADSGGYDHSNYETYHEARVVVEPVPRRGGGTPDARSRWC
jgi:hypothetical protein